MALAASGVSDGRVKGDYHLGAESFLTGVAGEVVPWGQQTRNYPGL
jgi:hypothetical protein